ncbi:hypothetical protein Taro_018556 [Colocasia esculenta]|uniref:Uncharacterized protein n=1 Tax=Colocasia esculenta TaxID=4460 RepID=A0A843URB5_COLES|nr:hypothetical protein [Colocasia esculenta]
MAFLSSYSGRMTSYSGRMTSYCGRMTSYTGRTISSSQWTEGYIDWRNNLSGSLSGNIPSRDRICNVSPTATGAPNSFCTITCRGREEFPMSRRTVQTRSWRKFSEFHIPELKEGKKRGRKEGEAAERKEEAKKRKAERKKKEEKEAKRKKKKEEEDQRKKEAQRKKQEEEAERKREEEEDEHKKKMEEEEEEKKRKRRHISPSSLSRRVSVGTRIRRQPECYTPDDFRDHKATKVNVSTSEPIFVDSQESTGTLPRGKKEERRDYVAREALGVAEKSLIERFLNECIISEYVLQEFMFNGSEEGLDNFLSFHDIRELLFATESESVVIDCYVNAYLFRPREENPDIFWNFGYLGAVLKDYVQSCRDDKSKKEHFEYAFRTLDRAPN